MRNHLKIITIDESSERWQKVIYALRNRGDELKQPVSQEQYEKARKLAIKMGYE